MFRKIIVISSILLLAIAIIGCSENVVEPKQVEQTPIIQEVTREVIKEVQAAPIIQTKLDNTPRIAVISAFGAELALLLENAEIEKMGRRQRKALARICDMVRSLAGSLPIRMARALVVLR